MKLSVSRRQAGGNISNSKRLKTLQSLSEEFHKPECCVVFCAIKEMERLKFGSRQIMQKPPSPLQRTRFATEDKLSPLEDFEKGRDGKILRFEKVQ